MPQRIKGKIQPRHSLVVVRKHEQKEKITEGGIVISGAVGNQGVVFATVVDVGPGRLIDSGALVKINLQRGDTVLVQIRPDTMPLSIEERSIFLVPDEHIVARIIEPEQQENENVETADES